ncbi:hypothetical protein OB919_11885 [Halobacteria archaeon AArc-curdl1]|uniref:Uncharacterized protein n=1 Tax=Natronosalvus hydrolyticus TaxID=2979988 RepID=A0AAP3E6N5_9EURY|nr:hypothetical protein [Halobacteria archaeon AArc-curdl1]
MMLRGKNVALSLLAVGGATVAGYLLRSRSSDGSIGQPKADVGARIVEEIPTEATVIDASSERLRELPGVGRAIRRAIRYDAREEWEHVTLEREGAWDIVDGLRRSLPYYESDDGHNGVYVRYDDRVVVLDAIGWARMEEPVQ